MKATEQYFPLVLFLILYEVVLNFETVHKIWIILFYIWVR